MSTTVLFELPIKEDAPCRRSQTVRAACRQPVTRRFGSTIEL
jgi:hypothetical protein